MSLRAVSPRLAEARPYTRSPGETEAQAGRLSVNEPGIPRPTSRNPFLSGPQLPSWSRNPTTGPDRTWGRDRAAGTLGRSPRSEAGGLPLRSLLFKPQTHSS